MYTSEPERIEMVLDTATPRRNGNASNNEHPHRHSSVRVIVRPIRSNCETLGRQLGQSYGPPNTNNNGAGASIRSRDRCALRSLASSHESGSTGDYFRSSDGKSIERRGNIFRRTRARRKNPILKPERPINRRFARSDETERMVTGMWL
ncbi:hypothetical protein K0M31_005483 [Melipona bicolor]|uniref:Uncharacterized protein n=1 Tax=Melipona bicolor TaxID=60889 RepID=A0AA40FV56_9HYME|nr:hypothetical protein K0M31_005483 [Melipona bicolor]